MKALHFSMTAVKQENTVLDSFEHLTNQLILETKRTLSSLLCLRQQKRIFSTTHQEVCQLWTTMDILDKIPLVFVVTKPGDLKQNMIFSSH